MKTRKRGGTASERWLPVDGYSYYEVSDRGRVRSKDHPVRCRNGGTRIVKGCVFHGAINRVSGYRYVTLSKEDHKVHVTVHSLVLNAFVGPRPAGMECRHKNGRPASNRLSNLEWATHSLNVLDRKWHGRLSRKHTTTVFMARKVKRLIAAGLSQSEAGRQAGVSQTTANRIALGITHKDV